MRDAIPQTTCRSRRVLPVAMAVIAGSAPAQLTWTSVGGVAPTPRAATRVANVVFNQLVLLFGGADAGGVLGDTWGFDGVSWTQFAPMSSPSPRSHHVMAPFDYHVILFGGRDANGAVLGDAWIWIANQQVWSAAPGGPPARERAAFVGLAASRAVLFGGRAGTQVLGDTWICDPYGFQIWSNLPVAVAPPARHGHAMAHFNSDFLGQIPDRIVMFGGIDAAGNHLDDTWIFGWSGGVPAWTSAAPAVRPPARHGHAMSYSMDRGRVQLFGGEGQNGLLGDTWEWDGAAWFPIVTTGAPAPRAECALVNARHGPGYAPWDRMLVGGRDASGPIAQPWWVTSTIPATTAQFGALAPTLSLAVHGPWLGGSLMARVQTSSALAAPHLIAGFSNTTSVLGPLPLSLGPTFSNATLLVDPVLLLPMSLLSGTSYGIQLPLPPVPAVAGTHVFLQAIAYVPSNAAWGVSVGLDCTLGWL